MTDVVRLSKSIVGPAEQAAVAKVIEHGFLGMGEQTLAFEKALTQFIGHNREVVCVNTGTSALHLALQACGVGAGDEVLVPSITYVASFQAVSATGATPVACDIDLHNGCLSVDAARKKITKHTKAIMHVHYGSGLGNRSAVYQMANEHQLRVIEDAAHSFGSAINEKPIGADGDIICFSFDGIKNITTGEGGAIVSGDKGLMDKIRDYRLLAVHKDTEQRYQGKRSWDFDVTEQGWRYHMSNINAAIGLSQLPKLHQFGKVRRSLFERYQDELQHLPIQFLNSAWSDWIPHICPVLVAEDIRDQLRDVLQKSSIESGIHYKPNHLLTKYRQSDCPNAELFGKQTISLPLHPDLTYQDITRITSVVKETLGVMA